MVSPRIVAELVQRHEGDTAVPSDPEALARFYTFDDFAHFVKVYLQVMDLIRTQDDLYLLTYEMA